MRREWRPAAPSRHQVVQGWQQPAAPRARSSAGMPEWLPPARPAAVLEVRSWRFPFVKLVQIEDGAKARAGAVQQDANLTRWNLHQAGDLLMRQPFQATEPEDLGLFLGQL